MARRRLTLRRFEAESDCRSRIDLIAELKKLAAKTATPLDDQAIAWVEGMLRPRLGTAAADVVKADQKA